MLQEKVKMKCELAKSKRSVMMMIKKSVQVAIDQKYERWLILFLTCTQLRNFQKFFTFLFLSTHEYTLTPIKEYFNKIDF